MINERFGWKDVSHILGACRLFGQLVHEWRDIAMKILRPERIIRDDHQSRLGLRRLFDIGNSGSQ